MWPFKIHDILSALEAEESLRGSYKYYEFLKSKVNFSKTLSKS